MLENTVFLQLFAGYLKQMKSMNIEFSSDACLTPSPL